MAIAVACAPSTPGAPAAQAAKGPTTLPDLVKAASAEGKIRVAGPSNFGEAAFKKLLDALNAKHGTKLEGTYSSTGNLPDIVQKVITERAAGGKPSWDAVLLNDTFIWTLADDGDIAAPPYAQLFSPPQAAVMLDGKTVGFADQLILPAVNSKLVPEAERPKTWDEVVDPRWKGRIGVANTIHHFVRLSQVWGDERTTDFVKKLAALQPRLGLVNETYKLLTLGETRISFTQTNSQMDEGFRKGEPVAWASAVRPAIGARYQCGVTKDADNPNAATLLCGFMLDKAASAIWGESVGKQNIFDPSTTIGEIYAKNAKDVLVIDGSLSKKDFDARETKYRQLIGFR